VAFVYHAVPMSMVGRVLYPLNELARVAPDAADRQRAKYLGRDAVLHAEITPDGLRFNDTIHCGPIHPHHLYRARRDLDLPTRSIGTTGLRPGSTATQAKLFRRRHH
jgi:hypothetical protein